MRPDCRWTTIWIKVLGYTGPLDNCIGCLELTPRVHTLLTREEDNAT